MHPDPEYRYALYELKTDSEFQWLHISMTEEKLKRLEYNINQRGVTKPIITWKGFIVDGHKRYGIYHRRKIPFTVRNLDSWSRYAVLNWLCDSNLKRFDVTDEYRKYFIGRKFLIQMDSSDHHLGRSVSGSINPRPLHNKYIIAQDLGTEFKISRNTVVKYSQYSEALDSIRSREPDIAQNILSGKVRVSIDNVIEISQLSNDDLHILKDCFNEKYRERISISEIWHELRWNRVHPSVSPKAQQQDKSQINAEIKKMPEYDPDSDLMSLYLTIPMWKSSIERVKVSADIRHSSKSARDKLLRELGALAETAFNLSDYIMEKGNI